MASVFIYNGPTIDFKKQIPSTYTSLSELVNTLEIFRNTVKIVSDDAKEITEHEYNFSDNLVVYGDEFHGISESFMLNFVPQLAMLKFSEIYIQNPPHHISLQFKKLNYDVEENEHKYKAVTKSLIKKVNNDYEKRIIGQEIVKRELLLSLIPLLNRKNNKPIVLMFYGPAGVGKTETAKFISEVLGGKLFRKQFSMFQNNSYSTYLYGGSINENSFALDLLGRETNVVLLDEFDKVGSHFHSAFYELFDEGVFIDKNHRVDMERSIIICTSNYRNEEHIKEHLGEAIYSRFDNLIEFSQLEDTDKIKLIDMKINLKLKLYSTKDRELIDKNKLNSILVGNLGLMNNVREIDGMIQKLISLELLESILE